MRTCVELGHALGNQHWPALVKGDRVFVPLTVDRKVMASVMNTHRFEEHPLRVRAGRRDRSVSRAARVAAAVRRRRGPRARAHAGALRRRRRRDGAQLWAPAHACRLTPAAAECTAPRCIWRACCSSGTRCSRSGDSLSPAGSNRRSRSASSPTRRRSPRIARTAVEQAARGDGIAVDLRASRGRAGDLGGGRAHRRRVYARKLSGETRTMSVRMGKKFAEMGGARRRRAACSTNGARASTPAPRPAAIRSRSP